MISRRRFSKSSNVNTGIWLVTYSDLITLLLTFFVLLISIATIDERNKRQVLGSVASEFGTESFLKNPTAPESEPIDLATPGVMDDAPAEDLEPLKDKVFDESEKDLDFQENKYVQIFSINNDVLFTPGDTVLSDKGVLLLDRLLPYLDQVQYPLLIAGHTGARRDEEGSSYVVNLDSTALDSTWLLSLNRALAIYKHFVGRGISPARLSLEGFGEYRPRFSNNSKLGRDRNRRVDLVLDKRNRDWLDKVDALREKLPEEKKNLYYNGFEFNMQVPDRSN